MGEKRSIKMGNASGVPSVMTGLAIVDGLRRFNVKKIAVNCTYYDEKWCTRFVHFLELCGFYILEATTLSSQGLVEENIQLQNYGWFMTEELTAKSIEAVAKRSPGAEAMVIPGQVPGHSISCKNRKIVYRYR